jgi:hypothetical protein
MKLTPNSYTATLYWADTDEAEEVDFECPLASLEKLIEVANEVAARDYEPGFELVGIVNRYYNQVVYNPRNLRTRTTL